MALATKGSKAVLPPVSEHQSVVVMHQQSCAGGVDLRYIAILTGLQPDHLTNVR